MLCWNLSKSTRLINLFDMLLRLEGHEVAYAYGWLANAYGISTNEPVTRSIGPDHKTLADALAEIEKVCQAQRLDLPVTLDYIPIVRRKLQSATTYADVQAEVGQLRERMHSELKSRLFLHIPSKEAGYYNITE